MPENETFVEIEEAAPADQESDNSDTVVLTYDDVVSAVSAGIENYVDSLPEETTEEETEEETMETMLYTIDDVYQVNLSSTIALLGGLGIVIGCLLGVAMRDMWK